MEKQQNKAQPDAIAYLRATIKFADWIGQSYKDLVDEKDSPDFVRELYLCACMGIDPDKIAEAKVQPNPPHSMAALRRVALESGILAGPELKLSQLTERIDGTEDTLEDIRSAIDKLAVSLQDAEERASVIREEKSATRIELPVIEETSSHEDGITEQVTKAALGAVAAAPATDSDSENGKVMMQDGSQDKQRETVRQDMSIDKKEDGQGLDVQDTDLQGADAPVDKDSSRTQQPESEDSSGTVTEVVDESETVPEKLAITLTNSPKKSWLERRKIRKERKKMLPFLNQVMAAGYNEEQIEFLLAQLEAGDTPDEAALYASPNLPVEVMERLRGIYTKGDKNHG